MKKYPLIILLILATGFLARAQSTDPLINNCVMNTGSNTRYLKDFRVQLGKGSTTGEMRYKAQMSLWKNTKYRFSMCNSDDSQGQLILTIKDESNKVVLSSYDQNTKKVYPFIDFICNKSGIYTLNYDFNEGNQGSGVGVVSMVR
ncbi:MAG TPA: hypothetical protein PK719_08885 [Bacteroidales bacterium]|jgi:hypothetical protein|nr:hypothetical protein [Bacteroidales bacterium]OQB63053.1 MAG: hypothetical protein BWX96_01268 [Bacteroidetes bacterium ADurb.Bin145]HOU01491.1 hypothetical protein [Bacteroidales bacterium]HQG63761.1 hypothetical protein [Bacteroidales bacterium]HQK67652.1 hypothetical protein [Bacteroidales bacterium]